MGHEITVGLPGGGRSQRGSAVDAIREESMDSGKDRRSTSASLPPTIPLSRMPFIDQTQPETSWHRILGNPAFRGQLPTAQSKAGKGKEQV